MKSLARTGVSRGLPLAAAAAALFIIAGGCRGGDSSGVRSTLGVKIGARDVKAVIDGPAFISAQGDAAVVTFGERKLVVEKARVLLDDKEEAKIPAAARAVEVEYAGGKLAVKADGAVVLPK